MKKNIGDCICGNHNYHTRECKRNQRLKPLLEKQRERRRELRKKHICIYNGCGKKVKPIIIYYQYCKKHKQESKVIQIEAR